MSRADEADGVAAALRLARSCLAVLDQRAISTILHGSLTLGDFRAGRSDLDLLLLVDGVLTERESDRLVAVVRDTDPSPAGGIDLTVVTRESAAVPTPRLELHVGRYLGPSEGVEIDGRADHVPDLWVELSMARADGRALEGAAPPDVIGEVPDAAVRDRGLHWLRVWLDLTDDEKNASFMALTACRIWRFAAEGTHSGKSAAARWALERDPSLVAVRSALAQRTGEAAAPFGADDVGHVLETVFRQVDGR